MESQVNGSTLIGFCLYFMGMYQCIHECVVEKWAYDVTILNIDTQKVVKKFSLPKEELQLDGDD